ncbi:hypothetical protein BIY21_20775 [Vibrio ponticus]|uniref:Aminoglycoside phosphotransferase n=1 Tax=Vibrio ponticus TaxID=265668 RepID=A0ABX3FMM8_9VIBR|nr:hypothetical protein [Vibrio ponticus]OLQ95479.1 hypothetical protein BIY21_20775 [Vibrio ponticus]
MQKIKPNHHRSNDLRGSHLTSALKKLAELQSAKGITPPVLAYDSNTRMLKIIDSTFYFYLKNANLEDAIEDIVNPVECVDC